MDEQSAPRTARGLARAEMTNRILRHARGQLQDAGPGELSLRAIARDLGMASSAIYRYFSSRDELLTALLVEVYGELGDTLQDAQARVRPRTAYGRRFTVLSRTLRSWAVQHPHDWALLYGSPVPGYAAPQDTVPAAGRTTGAFIGILVDAQARGAGLRVDGPRPTRRALASVAGLLEQLDEPIDEDLLLRGMTAWSAVMGSISLELFGHLHRAVVDYPAYFDQLVARVVHDLGLD
jgi:AcrR family transcriptional regulator